VAVAVSALATAVAVSVALGAGVGKLTFVNAKFDGQGGVDGLAQAYDVFASPDGNNVYVKGDGDSAVATFNRNAKGKLSFVNAKFDGQGGVDGIQGGGDVAVSPDGKNVYATGNGDSAIATFKRQSNGKLKFVNAKFDGADGVDGLAGAYLIAISPDGKNVYVGGYDEGAIAVFKRKQDGKLKFLNAIFDGQGGVDGLANIFGITVSPDGKNVYATGEDDNAVATFKRNKQNGKLTFVEELIDGQNGVDGIGSADGVAVSRDGDNVYVVSDGDSAIATFKRKQNGKLDFVNAKFDDQGGVNGLSQAYDLAVSRDGRNVYVAGCSDNAIATFKRKDNGKLSFVNAKVDGQGGVDGMACGWRVTMPRDDKNVYVAAYDDSAVATFKRKH
jgi:6-phosphogluconolactonase (cycloisomerase 2 family)